MNRCIRRLLLFIILFEIIFCVSVSAASVSLSKNKTKKATLVVAQTVSLKIPGKTVGVKWSSSKKNVASVSKKGVVTAKKAGKTVITGKTGKTKYKCNITVKKNVFTAEDYDYYAEMKVNDIADVVAKVIQLQFVSKYQLKIKLAVVPFGTSLELTDISLRMYGNNGSMFFEEDFELDTPKFAADEKGIGIVLTADIDEAEYFKVIDLTKLRENSFNYHVRLKWLT